MENCSWGLPLYMYTLRSTQFSAILPGEDDQEPVLAYSLLGRKDKREKFWGHSPLVPSQGPVPGLGDSTGLPQEATASKD